MTNITKESIVGQLVAQDYRTATLFKNHGIDFCCNGNRTLEDVCIQKQLTPEYLISELKSITGKSTTSETDYNSWPLNFLADYIEKKHHRYVETRIREITPFLEKVMRVHGKEHPELYEVNNLFQSSASELLMHMKKEEMVLFPYIRRMAGAESNDKQICPPFSTVQKPIKMMMDEHTEEGERFRKIADLTNNYTPPVDACNTYRVTYSLLQEFEDDLHLHIHLENNILFPKSIALESTLLPS